MIHHSLNDLPSPPSGKTGWPWTVATPPVPGTLPDGGPWPKISIVTPSYNQGQFIEETIRSVILQGYSNLEYVIIDGGSTDETTDIISEYEPWLTHCVSEPDSGQADAINKGLDRVSGDLIAYINSDDTYLPGAFSHVARVFKTQDFDLFIGMRRNPFRPKFFLLSRYWWKLRKDSMFKSFIIPPITGHSPHDIPQECVFWSGKRHENLRFDTSFHFCLDAEWFYRILPGARVVESAKKIATLRSHPQSKTATLKYIYEAEVERLMPGILLKKKAITDEQAESIMQSYRKADRKAFFLKIFAPAEEVLFCYDHPRC